jgi:hypothetical protein
MNKPAFFLAAMLLAIAALVTQGVARSYVDEAMHRKAARLNEAVKQQTAFAADPQGVQASQKSKALTTTGIVFTVLSVACMITARIRREPGWYFILLLLLVFGIVTPMLL